MSDPELQRLLALRKSTGEAYAEACDALAKHAAFDAAEVRRDLAADPLMCRLVRDAVEAFFASAQRDYASAQLARGLACFPRMPSSKTLENVYLPAIRETCPHAVQSGNTWLWYRNAAKSRQVSRDTAGAGA